MTYEEANEKLEKVLYELENTKPGLDRSLELYQEGIRLYRLCSQLLEEAELKITKLNSNGDEVEFATEEEK